MSVVRRHLADGAVSPNKLAAANYDGSYFRYVGDHTPRSQDFGGTGGPPSGVDTDQFTVGFNGGDLIGCFIGGPQTTRCPYNLSASKGLIVSLDETDTFGVEYTIPGYSLGDGPHAIDSDIKDGSFIRFKGQIRFVAGIDPLVVGYRVAGAVDPEYDAYTDYGVLYVTAGDVIQGTNNADAGEVTVNPGISVIDQEEFELKVVFRAGYFRFYFNGVEIGNRVAPEAGLRLIPFIQIVQTATTSLVYCKELEFGKLADVDDTQADGQY